VDNSNNTANSGNAVASSFAGAAGIDLSGVSTGNQMGEAVSQISEETVFDYV
jgi:hypothetical protein